MVITDTDLQNMIAKLSANRGKSPNVTFSQAVAAAAKDADGKCLEMLRVVRAMARRLGVELPENREDRACLVEQATDRRGYQRKNCLQGQLASRRTYLTNSLAQRRSIACCAVCDGCPLPGAGIPAVKTRACAGPDN